MTETVSHSETGGRDIPVPSTIDYGIPRDVERAVESLVSFFDITEFGEYRLSGDAWTDTDGVIVSFGLVARKAIEIDERLAEHRHLLDVRIRKRQTRKVNASFVSVAATLWINGYSPVPLRDGDKSVRIAEWTERFCNRRPSLDEIETEWSAGYRGFALEGVGIATHARVGMLDCENASAREDVLRMIPRLADTPTVISAKAEGGGKIVVLIPEGIELSDWNLTVAQTGGRFEILAQGRQGAIPPTPYKDSGKTYTWADESRTLLNTPRDKLIELTVAELQLLADHFTVAKTAKSSKTAAQKTTKALSQAARVAGKIAERIQWNGNAQDFSRDMSAIWRLDFNRWKPWSHAALAIAAKYGTYQPAWDEWGSWARQWRPKDGETAKVTNAEMREMAIAAVAAGRFVTMAWVVSQAKTREWDASLARWPGIVISKATSNDVEVMPAGAASEIARSAHLLAALTDKRLSPIDKVLVGLVHQFWSKGAAWMSIERLETLSGYGRTPIVRSLSHLQALGYLQTDGYGIGGTRRSAPDKRSMKFTVPDGMSWDTLIADRDYALGCPLNELQGARCPDEKTQGEWIARRKDGVSGSWQSGRASNGAPSTGIGREVCVPDGAAGAAVAGGSAGAEAGTVTGSPARSASEPRDMTESEWSSILLNIDIIEPVNEPVQDNIVTFDNDEGLKIARFEADQVEPEHRTTAQWLASSSVPVSVNALASKCNPGVVAFRDLAGDLARLSQDGIDQMDVFDILTTAVNAITFNRATRRNHPVTALPLRKPKDNGRTIATPTETMDRLRERFVVELHAEGIMLPDTESVIAERERRKSFSKSR